VIGPLSTRLSDQVEQRASLLWAAALLLFGLFCSFSAQAETPLPELRGHVTDLAELLSASRRDSLERELTEYERKTGHQFAFVSVETLDSARREVEAGRQEPR
jgi:uncharacterized membrane protein YgcG